MLLTNCRSIVGVSQKTYAERNVSDYMRARFGFEDYLELEFADVMLIPRDTQKIIISTLVEDSVSKDHAISGRALFRLATANAIGLGTNIDLGRSLEFVLKSAQREYIPAQAVATAWFIANGKTIPIDEETQIDWLFEATAWGSSTASKILKRFNEKEYVQARDAFHRSGGFNQFFYAKESPYYIGSATFRQSLGHELKKSQEELSSIAIAAAVYGDSELLSKIFRVSNLDANLSNAWGETLLVLCCKGGHLHSLKVIHSSIFL